VKAKTKIAMPKIKVPFIPPTSQIIWWEGK